MARLGNKLTDRKVRALREPGRYGDGNGLWLQVAEGAGQLSKSWLFRFVRNGKDKVMGLGPADLVSLAEAREKAIACRRMLLEGKDPLEERRAAEAARRATSDDGMTFEEAAEAYVNVHESGWKNDKHKAQWRATLGTYAYPVIGGKKVRVIDTSDVLAVLQPIWSEKPETASRLRGRMQSVLDWATVRREREGDNPARWRGHLDHLLPKPAKLAARGSHAALPWREMAGFIEDLQRQDGIAALALQFTILTAARTNETIGARLDEFDLKAGIWTIPAERMKATREHRVVLSAPAIEIARALAGADPVLLFPGGKAGKPLSNMAMTSVLKRMGRDEITVHGFRSSFKTWATEATEYPNELSEIALAHNVGTEVERAYRRGDMIERRRSLMKDWATHCGYEVN